MKVVINNSNEKKELPFPKLMISKDSGTVVLFSEDGIGTQLNVDISRVDYAFIGTHSRSWAMKLFTDFTGSITLSND